MAVAFEVGVRRRVRRNAVARNIRDLPESESLLDCLLSVQHSQLLSLSIEQNINAHAHSGPCTQAFWPARGSVNELAFLVSDQLNKGTFFSIHKGVNHEVVRPEGGKSTNWRARPVRVAIDPSSAAIASS